MGSSENPQKPTISKDEEIALEKEFNRLKNSQNLQIVECKYVNDNKKHWQVVFEGSKRSPYENGFFILDFLFNKGTFPEKGPEAIFKTKMFHPNVYDNGHVCINLLNSWDPKISIEHVLFGILDILDNPVPQGGYSNEARALLEKNVEQYYKKVEEYTYLYAMNDYQ